MPTPSLTKSSDINTELGKGSTTILRMGDANTRNVACISSGAISFGNCRWGINFPGREISAYRGFTQIELKKYDTDNRLDVFSSDILPIYGTFDIVSASAVITLFSNGVMRIEATNSAVSAVPTHFTWLTSGVNSDYTAQFNITSGALSAGSSSANTDLALSTDRTWFVQTNTLFGTGGDQSDTSSAGGNLIIKDSGGTLITRPISLYSEAVLGSL